MTCIAATVIARHTAAIVLATPSGTAAMPPRPANPSGVPVIVERVEVPVPVDDTSAEILQMALAAAIAAAATQGRLRRPRHRPTTSQIIDITDSLALNGTVHNTYGPGPHPAEEGAEMIEDVRGVGEACWQEAVVQSDRDII